MRNGRSPGSHLRQTRTRWGRLLREGGRRDAVSGRELEECSVCRVDRVRSKATRNGPDL